MPSTQSGLAANLPPLPHARVEGEIAAIRAALDGLKPADFFNRSPGYAEFLSAFYDLTEIDPVWEEATSVAAENGMEWCRDRRQFVEVAKGCRQCTRNGWYESFSGGFATERPCGYCNAEGLPQRQRRAA